MDWWLAILFVIGGIFVGFGLSMWLVVRLEGEDEGTDRHG